MWVVLSDSHSIVVEQIGLRFIARPLRCAQMPALFFNGIGSTLQWRAIAAVRIQVAQLKRLSVRGLFFLLSVLQYGSVPLLPRVGMYRLSLNSRWSINQLVMPRRGIRGGEER